METIRPPIEGVHHVDAQIKYLTCNGYTEDVPETTLKKKQ
jgi:hypothetical protein